MAGILTLTLSRGWWGKCEKKNLPEEEGRVEKKSAREPGLKPGTYHMLGEGLQLHITGVL